MSIEQESVFVSDMKLWMNEGQLWVHEWRSGFGGLDERFSWICFDQQIGQDAGSEVRKSEMHCQGAARVNQLGCWM